MEDPDFEALRVKYLPVLKALDRLHVRLEQLGLADGKLVIRAEAPSEQIKDQVWDEIKAVDPSFAGLDARIELTEEARAELEAITGGPNAEEVYTVQPGDSLRSIAESYYGDPNQYVRLWNANRGELRDPDRIRPGQRLIIPIE